MLKIVNLYIHVIFLFLHITFLWKHFLFEKKFPKIILLFSRMNSFVLLNQKNTIAICHCWVHVLLAQASKSIFQEHKHITHIQTCLLTFFMCKAYNFWDLNRSSLSNAQNTQSYLAAQDDDPLAPLDSPKPKKTSSIHSHRRLVILFSRTIKQVNIQFFLSGMFLNTPFFTTFYTIDTPYTTWHAEIMYSFLKKRQRDVNL